MNDSVEVLNSVGLDEMTRKAIGLVANEIEAKIRGNLQSALHEAAEKELAEVKSKASEIKDKIWEDLQSALREAAAKELAEVKSNVQLIENTLAEIEKRLLSEHRSHIDEMITKQQDAQETTNNTLVEIEKRLLSEHRSRIDDVQGKLVKTQYALLGLIAVTLLATITGIFL